ncbi:AAA family ATPase [Bariatricus sp. HCP28S3_A7]|uniref:AAA family ATPase n=1 Tax=Bariatricus sp. HCP28S3_A7 TaxID=3438894 RepID=UPI003F8BA459
MGHYLNPGNEGFKRALRSRIYGDKTEMIEYVNSVLGTEEGFICVSRPRRFRKSMAANMLAAYYDRSCNSETLFKTLKISDKSGYIKLPILPRKLF